MQGWKFLYGEDLSALRIAVCVGYPSLKQTDKRRPVVGGSAGNDSIEILRVALCERQSLVAAIGDAAEVRIGRLPPIVGSDHRLHGLRKLMLGAVTEHRPEPQVVPRP